jgi:hypothetical protein
MDRLKCRVSSIFCYVLDSFCLVGRAWAILE